MGIPNDEQFEAAFGELAEAAAVMANPAEASVLRARVRRRRAARAGVAGVAAVAVLSASGWLVQHALGQDTDPPPADDATTVVVEPTPTAEDPTSPAETTTTAEEEHAQAPTLPEFDDLAGTAMDLPSFMPGESIDGICRPDGAELTDGRTGEFMRTTGQVALLEVVHARMTDGGQERAVAFLGCRFAEAVAYQAVLLAEDGNGGWTVDEQLIHSKSNADRPYDLMADADYGVLVAVAEIYACCGTDPDELDYWVERLRLDGDDVVSERLEESALGGSTNITDLSITVTVEETAQEGVWTIDATVRNEGDRTSAPFHLVSCASIDSVEWPYQIEHCWSDTAWIETFDALAAGETWRQQWEVTVAPSDERSNGAFFRMEIEPDLLADGIARDLDAENNQFYYDFPE